MQTNISLGCYLKPEIGFSRAVRSGQIVAVSGTAPIGNGCQTGGVGDVYRQTLRCFEIALQALEAGESGLGDVIRTLIMLTDIATWKEAGRAHGEVFSSVRPAFTFVEVEIDAVTER
ncbi:MAG: Rid family hydrolase [Pseudomonadota bacterium]